MALSPCTVDRSTSPIRAAASAFDFGQGAVRLMALNMGALPGAPVN